MNEFAIVLDCMTKKLRVVPRAEALSRAALAYTKGMPADPVIGLMGSQEAAERAAKMMADARALSSLRAREVAA